MQFKKSAMLALAATCAGGLGLPSIARATFHEWRIDELYSNASGTVQFIELQQPSFEFDDERFVGSQILAESALGHSFTFPSNLPGVPVADQNFLVATPGFASLPGAPTPDYVLPSNNWFSTAGDTLNYASGIDTLSFTGSQLPTDGINSINRAWGTTPLITGRETPTNFAGVPEPATLGLLIIGAGLGLMRRRRAV
ncbi:MAG TPA: PEP-CTERM sorting domain-containing protein [Tepidisphaeraceae bacterium]|nr:PEP-CTERM sorting domain-containing protein [Tepidisphaeraceae bacterium]